MSYRIVKRPRAWWPVEWTGVDEDGAPVTNRIELRFRLLKVDAAKVFIADAREADRRENDAGVDLPQLYSELVARVAEDWRGLEAENGEPLRWDVPDGWADDLDADGKRRPLDAPNLRVLLNEPNMFGHVFAAYRECLAGEPKRRAGN